MTPKQKAEEIYSKCLDAIKGLEGSEWWESSKQCALIAADEVLNDSSSLVQMEYWNEVKQEIEKL